jgi:hypothetical protein
VSLHFLSEMIIETVLVTTFLLYDEPKPNLIEYSIAALSRDISFSSIKLAYLILVNVFQERLNMISFFLLSTIVFN